MSRGADQPRVLVAGGTGFLGAAFVRALDDRGVRVSVLSRSPGKVRRRFAGRDVEARRGDVTDPSTLAPAVAGADVLIQCVQFPGYPVEDPRRGRTFLRVDAEGTRNLVSAAEATGVGKLVYLSGVGADASATESWFRAKGMAEAVVRDARPTGIIVRPSWVYGPEDRSLNRFAAILRWVPFAFPQLGDGSQRINPVFVGDLAELVVRSVLEETANGATIEIGGPVTYTMDMIVRLLMEAMDREKPIVHLPVEPARIGASLAELLPGRPFSRDAVRFVTQGAVADLSVLRRLFPTLDLTPMPRALARYVGDTA